MTDKPCEAIDDPLLMPGWGCCKCRVYNGVQRTECKSCSHKRCDKPRTFTCNNCHKNFIVTDRTWTEVARNFPGPPQRRAGAGVRRLLQGTRGEARVVGMTYFAHAAATSSSRSAAAWILSTPGFHILARNLPRSRPGSSRHHTITSRTRRPPAIRNLVFNS